ncbi:MAG: DUF465 domain-containing protein [Pseudomonadota bacterium]
MTEIPKMDRADMLRVRLQLLRDEHSDLDQAIGAMEERPAPDMLAVRRLKKKKLQIKEEIVRIEDEIHPDIIA